MKLAARAGFAARGVIYVLVGVLAVKIAFGDSGAEADRRGALHEIAQQPFGKALLWLLALAFCGMTLWRLSEAAFGRTGPDGREPARRLASAGRAVFYAAVASGVFSVLSGGGGGGGSSNSRSRTLTAQAMEWPGGRWLVGAVGLGLVVAGGWIAVRALKRAFLRTMETGRMGPRTRRGVTALGMAGGTARGVVFAAAGVFAVVAAVTFDPGRAKGLDGTLRSFADTPAGPWLLVLVAVGLLLFGVFSFAMARWRRV